MGGRGPRPNFAGFGPRQEVPRADPRGVGLRLRGPQDREGDGLRPHQRRAPRRRPRVPGVLPQGPPAERHVVGEPRLRGERVVAHGRGPGVRRVPPGRQPGPADRVRPGVGGRQAVRPPPDDRAAEPSRSFGGTRSTTPGTCTRCSGWAGGWSASTRSGRTSRPATTTWSRSSTNSPRPRATPTSSGRSSRNTSTWTRWRPTSR